MKLNLQAFWVITANDLSNSSKLMHFVLFNIVFDRNSSISSIELMSEYSKTLLRGGRSHGAVLNLLLTRAWLVAKIEGSFCTVSNADKPGPSRMLLPRWALTDVMD